MRKFSILMAVAFMLLGTFQAAGASPREITWNDLIPAVATGSFADFTTLTERKGMPNVSEFNGSQDDLKIYAAMMDGMRQMQPQYGNQLAQSLDGQEVRIAGYVTPLTFDNDKVVEFLFVPYLGACMHVPPPPANQIVYVKNAQGLSADNLWEPFWLIGKLKATPVSTIVADVGYSMSAATIEIYTE